MNSLTQPLPQQGPLVDPGLCRICGFKKKCRVLNEIYDYMGQREVYSELIYECFGVIISQLDCDVKQRLVCATCVMRLRDCINFRRQIVKSEEKLISNLHGGEYGTNTIVEMKMDPHTHIYSYVVENVDEPTPELEEINIIKEAAKAKKRLAVFNKITKKEARRRKREKEGRRGGLEREGCIMYGPDAELKRKLLAKMNKLKALEPQTQEDDLLYARPRRREDNIMYVNTVNMVQNSYICPFNNIIGTYHCFYCKKTFIESDELRDHTLTHDPKQFERLWPLRKKVKIDVTRIDCRLCETKIYDIDTLKSHLSAVHNKMMHPVENEFLKFKLRNDNLECLECGDNFMFIDNLVKHMTEHFGTHVCDICGAGFVQQSSLESHLRCHKQTNQTFPCSVCNKSFKTSRSRYLHVSVVHEKKAIIKCFKCEKSFMSYERRDRHLVDDHGDTRSYLCKICGKNFSMRKQYVSHIRVAHAKQYKHQCQICSRNFYATKHLKKHMESHNINISYSM